MAAPQLGLPQGPASASSFVSHETSVEKASIVRVVRRIFCSPPSQLGPKIIQYAEDEDSDPFHDSGGYHRSVGPLFSVKLPNIPPFLFEEQVLSDAQKKLAGITPKYTELSEVLYGAATPKQVSYAMSLAKKAADWHEIAQSLGFDSVPNEHDFNAMSKQDISTLIDQLKNGPTSHGSFPGGQAAGQEPKVSGTGKATTAQVQYVLGLMAELGHARWVSKGMAKQFKGIDLAALKAMSKGEISVLIAEIKSALVGL
jgi:hypothetical protein